MKVKLHQAVKMFFGNSSFEMIFSEAIANALDAEATEVTIDISAKNYNDIKSLCVEIIDDGIGFTDYRFNKFSKLFDTETNTHKGLGRLVYLCYFESVIFESVYKEDDKYKHRYFKFTEKIEDEVVITDSAETKTGTRIIMSGFIGDKLHKHDFINPPYLQQSILEEFFPRLYKDKINDNNKIIKIKSDINEIPIERFIDTSTLPNLIEITLEEKASLIDVYKLHYMIQPTDKIGSIITAISIDDRTKKVDIISKDNTILNYDMIFILSSDWLKGKVDFSRQNITMTDADMNNVVRIFRKEVKRIIIENIEKEKDRIEHNQQAIKKTFPHLEGYFDEEQIGYIARKDIIKSAQDKFFKAQQKILEATELNDEQYEESVELASRSLMEYIIFRQNTIQKLQSIDVNNSEADIHKIIIPMKEKFNKSSFNNDLYRNNVWILDDKFMSYTTVLSDEKMTEVVDVITKGEVEYNDDRPDIVLVFSDDVNSADRVDVVVVELKKKGISHNDTMKVITQLETRARKLMKYYNNKIQRIWFYGIIEFNEEVELALSGTYTELYSTGKMYYKETNVAIQLNPRISLPIGIFVMDYDSLIKDANARNAAFFNVIKSKFKI